MLTAFAAVAWSVARDGLTRPVAMSVGGVRAGALGVLTLLLVGGHLGGSLVRGDGYLTRYLPDGARRAAGMAAAESLTVRRVVNAERTPVFDSIVRPVLMQRCASCHNPSRTLGGLDVTSAKTLFAGGRQGKVIAPGRADESEIIVRVELPPGHLDAMPPDHHLPASEIALLRWWIDQGASTQQSLAEIARPPAMRRTLAAYGLDEVPSGVFALTLPPLDTTAVAAARKTGLTVQQVGSDVSLLSVDATSVPPTWSAGVLAALAPLAAHITELSLTRTNSNDSAFTDIGRMTHLTRLHVANTQITDAGLARLRGLEHLTYLNVVGTSVSDAAIDALSSLPRLRAVYLWGTRVTPDGAARLRRALPRATVVLESAPLITPDTTIAKPADSVRKAR
ncbi:MAG: hypothetical protein IT353_16105 [Gemmatimonadaceae bacterium]|nr:hypothetical protein [Gemmatimonadaceae bacterium]